MNSMQDNIREYSKGCERLGRRIAELSEQIASAYDGGAHKNLVERRYLLYHELAEMQGALRQMREYLTECGQDLPATDPARETVPASVIAPELWRHPSRLSYDGNGTDAGAQIPLPSA